MKRGYSGVRGVGTNAGVADITIAWTGSISSVVRGWPQTSQKAKRLGSDSTTSWQLEHMYRAMPCIASPSGDVEYGFQTP
jgi:hypothetical protein